MYRRALAAHNRLLKQPAGVADRDGVGMGERHDHPPLGPPSAKLALRRHPDPDSLYHRVKAADLEITRELQDTHYGNRTFTAVDPWSVTWTFGTYPGS